MIMRRAKWREIPRCFAVGNTVLQAHGTANALLHLVQEKLQHDDGRRHKSEARRNHLTANRGGKSNKKKTSRSVCWQQFTRIDTPSCYRHHITQPQYGRATLDASTANVTEIEERRPPSSNVATLYRHDPSDGAKTLPGRPPGLVSESEVFATMLTPGHTRVSPFAPLPPNVPERFLPTRANKPSHADV